MENVTIVIPKADEKEVSKIDSGDLGFIKKKFEKIDQVLYGIVAMLIFSVIAIIISVIGLFLDQLRFNNAAYTDYSKKLEAVNEIQISNENLRDENQKNQQLIIEQQNKIIEQLKVLSK